MEHKLNGYSLRAIAFMLQEEYELLLQPSISTVSEWLDEALSQTVTARCTDADRHAGIVLLRTEEMLNKVLPMALGKMIIQRTKRIDGESVVILDENIVDEQLKAVEVARKLMETQCRVLNRFGDKDKNNAAISGASMLKFIETTVTQFIVMPSQALPRGQSAALVLASGDSDIDALDAEAVEA